jgi:hypothetical protein
VVPAPAFYESQGNDSSGDLVWCTTQARCPPVVLGAPRFDRRETGMLLVVVGTGSRGVELHESAPRQVLASGKALAVDDEAMW